MAALWAGTVHGLPPAKWTGPPPVANSQGRLAWPSIRLPSIGWRKMLDAMPWAAEAGTNGCPSAEDRIAFSHLDSVPMEENLIASKRYVKLIWQFACLRRNSWTFAHLASYGSEEISRPKFWYSSLETIFGCCPPGIATAVAYESAIVLNSMPGRPSIVGSGPRTQNSIYKKLKSFQTKQKKCKSFQKRYFKHNFRLSRQSLASRDALVTPIKLYKCLETPINKYNCN